MNSTFYEQITKYHISYLTHVCSTPLTAADSFQATMEGQDLPDSLLDSHQAAKGVSTGTLSEPALINAVIEDINTC